MHFDVPHQRMKKDKYSATLIAHKIIYDYVQAGFSVKELAIGGWLTDRGLEISTEDDREGFGGDVDIYNGNKRSQNFSEAALG
jgi:hypothetical protein